MLLRTALIAATMTSLASLALGASSALADDFYCPPNPPPFVDNVRVVEGGTCLLDGTHVNGNVFVEYGGDLLAEGASIEGNVQAEDALRIRLLNSYVGGDVQAERTQRTRSRITGTELDSKIKGNMQIIDSFGSWQIETNKIRGDAQFFYNKGPIRFNWNTVVGNLQCKENADIKGGRNKVYGNQENQCVGFNPGDDKVYRFDDLTSAVSCGLGFEVALLLPPLMAAYGRRRARKA